jgi:Trypsin-like peptidase domain
MRFCFLAGLTLAIVSVTGVAQSIATDEKSVANELPADLSRAEIAKRGREATVFLEVPPNRAATAFCIHESGFFVTNHHSIVNAQGQIKVVLHSGTQNQKAVDVKVVREDRESDLALLKAEGLERLATVPLGNVADVSELMEVFVFGFPFGKGPGNVRKDYPSISVNAGTISSLKQESGKLVFLQLNASFNPGNSGGPILNSKGQVVGVVLGRVEARFGAGLDIAIPVNKLSRFLQRPDASLHISKDELVKTGESVEVVARITDILSFKTATRLEFVIDLGTPRERRMAMNQTDNVYRLELVPFPEQQGPKIIEATVEFPDGSIRGQFEDFEIQVGDTKRKMSELDIVRLHPKLEVKRLDGQTLDGVPVVPAELPVHVGGQVFRLNLRKATAIDSTEGTEGGVVSGHLVVKTETEEITVATTSFQQEGVARPTFESLRKGMFIRPSRSGVPVSYLRMESELDDFIGQGRVYEYEKDAFTFQSNPALIQCQVAPLGNWTLQFYPGPMRNIAAGEYRGAKRYPFQENAPGISIFGNGRGCNAHDGEFRIWEVEMQENNVVRLAVDFVQRCDGKKPSLVGMFRFNSDFR